MLYSSMAVGLFAFLPTIRKAYLDPASENALSWGIAVIANCLNLFAVSVWTPITATYPVYLALMQVVVFIPLAGYSLRVRVARRPV
jgi:hypothetical protein